MRVVSLTASAAFLSLVFPQGTALVNAPTGDQQISRSPSQGRQQVANGPYKRSLSRVRKVNLPALPRQASRMSELETDIL